MMITLMTVKEVAEILRVSEKTVTRLMDQNDMPYIKVGGSRRVDQDAFAAWLESKRFSGAVA